MFKIQSALIAAFQRHEITQLAIPCDVLQEIFTTRSVLDEAANVYPLASNISVAHANALYRTIMRYKPQFVVEIGMAYGISSLAILAALHDSKANGQLLSIDPGQAKFYKGVGVANVKRAKYTENHTFLQEFDYVALPDLLGEKRVIDFAYIDGWHTFDYSLLDFFYIDKMLKVDGVIGFNDCALPAIRKVLSFVNTHRKYKEIDVGLKRNYLTRSPFVTLKRLIFRISKSDRYFQKVENWEPHGVYWKSF